MRRTEDIALDRPGGHAVFLHRLAVQQALNCLLIKKFYVSLFTL